MSLAQDPRWINLTCQYSPLALTLPQGWQRDQARSEANDKTDIFIGPTVDPDGDIPAPVTEPQLLVKTIPTPDGTTNFQAIAVALKQQQLQAGGGGDSHVLVEETMTIAEYPARLDIFTYRDAALQTTVMQCQACIQQAESVCIVMGMAQGAKQLDYLQLFRQTVASAQFTSG